MTDFIYPNEAFLQWDLLIVIYPYITGLVAGAFIVSSLYHVFGLSKLKPVARISVVTALAFLLICPLPLVMHLGKPERGLEMFLRPKLISAMAGFGYIWMFYAILVIVETWLIFRKNIVSYYLTAKEGFRKTLYSILALGIYDISEKSLNVDKKIIKFLAMIGIPAACLLHGYVGFIFGAVKANPWWSTPLMPIIFLLSAIVSGIALLIVLYVIITKIRKTPLDFDCLHSLTLWLGGFLTLAIALEGLEVLSMLYESEESWGIILQLITQKIAASYFGIQYVFGSLLPLIILGSVVIFKMQQKTKTFLIFLSSVFILIGIFAMRWNVVIGGQLMSKSLRGFTTYSPPLLGTEGILVSALLMVLPFVLFIIISRVIPPWQEEVEIPEPRKLRF